MLCLWDFSEVLVLTLSLTILKLRLFSQARKQYLMCPCPCFSQCLPTLAMSTQKCSLFSKALFIKAKHLEVLSCFITYVVWSCSLLQQKTCISPTIPARVPSVPVAFSLRLALGSNSSPLAPVHQVYSSSHPATKAKPCRGSAFAFWSSENFFYYCHLPGISPFTVLKISKIAFSSSFNTSINRESTRLWNYERYPAVCLFGGLGFFKAIMFQLLLFTQPPLFQGVLHAAVTCLWQEFSLQSAHTQQADFGDGSAVGYSCRVHLAR